MPPDVVTLLGLAVAGAAVPLAALGGRWWLVAAAVVVLSGLIDTLDGVVAVLTGRTSRWGFVLDSTADRVADTAYVVALWAAGAPGPVAAAGGGIALLLEYVRARAIAGGMAEIGVVSVWERPSRVIVTAVFLACAGAFADSVWADLGAWAWVGLGIVGLAQVLLVVRRRLR